MNFSHPTTERDLIELTWWTVSNLGQKPCVTMNWGLPSILFLILVILRHKTRFQICLPFSQAKTLQLIIKTYIGSETHFSFYYAQRSKEGKYLMMENSGHCPRERTLLLQMGTVETLIIFISIIMKYVLFTKTSIKIPCDASELRTSKSA